MPTFQVLLSLCDILAQIVLPEGLHCSALPPMCPVSESNWLALLNYLYDFRRAVTNC